MPRRCRRDRRRGGGAHGGREGRPSRSRLCTLPVARSTLMLIQGVLVDALDHGAFVVVGSLDALLGDEAEGRAFLQRAQAGLDGGGLPEGVGAAALSLFIICCCSNSLVRDDVPATNAHDEHDDEMPLATESFLVPRLQAVGVVHGFLGHGGAGGQGRRGAGAAAAPARANFGAEAAWAAPYEARQTRRRRARNAAASARRLWIRDMLFGPPGLGMLRASWARGGQVKEGCAARATRTSDVGHARGEASRHRRRCRACPCRRNTASSVWRSSIFNVFARGAGDFSTLASLILPWVSMVL